MVSAVVALLLAQAPMADVWPFQGKRLADGVVEYTYDLTALRASKGFADAKEANGDAAVKAFLAALPKQVSVRVSPGTPYSLTAGQGLESAPLATAFSLTPDGPLASDNPLARKEGARLRAPLDPRTPKVLVGVEQPLWLARQLEDAALLAVELDTEWLRRELWNRVGEAAVARFKRGGGDAREGGLTLAARVFAAASCRDPSRVPAAVKADVELKTAVEAELARLAEDVDGQLAPAPWAFNPELSCAWFRARALSRPFEQTRAATAAVLVFLQLLERDPKLAALFERTRQRRDRFVGLADEPLAEWKKATGGDAARGLDSMSAFIESLPVTRRDPPPLVGWPSTPTSKFLAELSGPERAASIDELASAVQDKRVAAGADAPWPVLREAALAPLVTDSGKAVQIDSGWRDRLAGAFAALQGSHRDARRGGLEADDEVLERTALKLRLNVPPFLEIEPIPAAYERQARSLEALIDALTAENLTSLKGLTPDGRRTEGPLVTEAKRLVALLEGLAKLAKVEATQVDGKVVDEARRLLASWRAEQGLARDVRAAFASPFPMGDERSHTAIVGVSRRELLVGYVGIPRTELVAGGSRSFVVNAAVEQRYLVPVLVTVGLATDRALKPADRSALKATIDAAGRRLDPLEGLLHEMLHGGEASSVSDR